MSFEFETDFACLLLFPLVAITPITCDQCDEVHGWCLMLGWGFWELNIFFE